MMNSKRNLKYYFPYLLIVLLGALTYHYSKIFIKFDFDGYYGKYVGKKAYNFNLKSSKGKTIELRKFRGNFVFITFGFTKCTGVCPLNLHRFKQLSKNIASKGMRNINFVFISFDDLRDNSTEMGKFINNFSSSNVLGLLGRKGSGLDVARKYNNHISFEKDKLKNLPDYQINHNGFLYLVDPHGDLALVYMQQDLLIKNVVEDVLLYRKEIAPEEGV